MFSRILVANRGAVAARIIRAASELGIKTVSVYSEADREAPYLAVADESIHIGNSPPVESYLNQARILEVLTSTGCDGLHPGYGFLAENAEFATSVAAHGAVFIGPAPKWLEAMGHKTKAISLAREYGIPTARSSGVLESEEDFINAAQTIGYPLLIKPARGGGGIGMLEVEDEKQLIKQLGRARSTAVRSFSSRELFLEKRYIDPRHIEVQIVADDFGQVRHLFERDCSIQRRNQKIIEEARAPGIDQESLSALFEQITSALGAMGYNNIGTVEMLMDEDGKFSFLEMNTRLQVEHGVTEEVLGLDLVKTQIRLAAGESLSEVLPEVIEPRGHAIEARLYAEDPVKFYPSPGTLEVFRLPKTVRVETGYTQGMNVTPFYDPLLAKLIAAAETRDKAIDKLVDALESCEIGGVKSNVVALVALLTSEEFGLGRPHTGLTAQIIKKP